MSTAPPDTQDNEQSEQSELAKLLAPAMPYINKYGSKIVLALAAILLLAAIYIFWSRSAAAAASAGWGDLSSAAQPEDFADIADGNPNTVAAAWARLAEADGYLGRAIKASFSDRAASKGIFDKSRDAYEQVLSMRSSTPEVLERALFGVARLEESLTGEDTSVAVAAYEELLSKYPESIFKEEAEGRVVKLKDPDVQRFYGWFAAQNPSIGDGLNLPNVPGTPEKSAIDDLMESLPVTPTGDAFNPADLQTPSAPEAPGEPETPADGGNSEAGAEEEGAATADDPQDPPKADKDGSEEK